MRPVIDAALMNELRRRVIAHNEANPAVRTKLGTLKKIYEGAHRGPTPGLRAMAKVDRHLAGLAKADFKEDEHPRGHGGEFSSTGKAGTSGKHEAPAAAKPSAAGLPQARTVAEHKALQAENPTYAALTTDTIPERRGELYGRYARFGASLGGGALLALGLMRGRSNGLTARTARFVGGKAGRFVAGVPAAVASYGGNAIGNALHHGLASRSKVIRSLPRDALYANAARATRNAAEAGETVGRAAGAAVHSGARTAVQLAMEAAAGGSKDARARQIVGLTMKSARARGATIKQAKVLARSRMKTERLARAGRMVGTHAALSLGAGVAAASAVEGTRFDPERWGQSYDNVSYRFVAKAWRDGRGAEQPLRKIRYTGLTSRVALSALAGIGGGLATGAAAHGLGHATGFTTPGHGGNPYRDKDGRFTSKETAVGGAGIALGAALSAGAVFAALRGRNTKLFARAVDLTRRTLASRLQTVHLDTVKNALAGKNLAGKAAGAQPRLHPELAARVEGRAARVKELVETGKGGPIDKYRELVERNKTRGSYDLVHYQEAARQDLNRRIGEVGAMMDRFAIPYKGGTATMAELRATHTGAELRHLVATTADTMDDRAVLAAVKNLSPSDANIVKTLHAKRGAVGAEVEAALAARSGEIEARRGAMQATGNDLKAAKHGLDEAKRNLAAADPVQQPTRQGEVDVATATHAAADAAHLETGRQFAEANNTGPDIKLASGVRIGQRDVLDAARRAANTEASLRFKAEDHARGIADKEILDARDRLERGFKERANRVLAAQSVKGSVSEAVPEEAQLQVRKIVRHAETEARLKGRVAATADDLAAVANEVPAGRAAASDAAKAARKASKAQDAVAVSARNEALTASAQVGTHTDTAARLDAVAKSAQDALDRLPPGRSKARTQAAAALKAARQAVADHAPQLDLARRYAKSMGNAVTASAAEAARLSAAAQDLEAKVALHPAKTSARMAAEQSHAAAKAAADAHDRTLPGLTAKLEEALADPVAPKLNSRARPAGSQPAIEALGQDLDAYIADPVKSKVKDFLGGPTFPTLRSWADTVGGSIGGTFAGTGTAIRDAYRTAFMKPSHEIGGPYVHSIPKVLRNYGLGLGALTGAVGVGRDVLGVVRNVRDKGLVDGVTTARFDTIRREETIDPINGTGYVGLSVEDPSNKNERVLLWGERTFHDRNTNRIETKSLVPGGRVSALRQRIQNENQGGGGGGGGGGNGGGGGGDAPGLDGNLRSQVDAAVKSNLSDPKRTVQVKTGEGDRTSPYRHPGTTGDQHALSARFFAAVNGMVKGGKSHDALASVFSNQGRILTPKDAYKLLTGATADGRKDQDAQGIFDAKRFQTNDADEIVGALGSEIAKARKQIDGNPKVRVHMHRAVALAAHVKGLDADAAKSLHDQVRGGAAQPADASGEPRDPEPPGPDPKPRKAAENAARPGEDARFTGPDGRPLSRADQPNPGSDMSHEALHAAVRNSNHGLARFFSVDGDPDTENRMHDAVFGMARVAAAHAALEGHKIGPATAVQIVTKLMRSRMVSGHGHGDRATGLDRLLDPNFNWDPHIKASMDDVLESSPDVTKAAPSEGLGDLCPLDDLEALVKLNMAPFEEALHPRLPKGVGGGEFAAGAAAAGHGSHAERLVREGGDAIVEGRQKSERETHGAPQSALEPVRLGRELGTSLGNEAGWTGASALAGRVLPTIGGTYGKIIGFGLRSAAGLVGASVAGEAAGEAGEAAGHGLSALAGRRGPAHAVSPEYHDGGEQAAEMVGGFAGQAVGSGIGAAAGTALLPGVGTVAGGIVGGAIGNYAGGLSTRGIYNYFAGYDQDKAAQVMQRYAPKPAAAPKPRPPRPPRAGSAVAV